MDKKLRFFVSSTSVIFAGSTASSIYYRPISSSDDGKVNRNLFFCSKSSLINLDESAVPWLYGLSRHISILSTVCVMKLVTFSLGNLEIKYDQHYFTLLDYVKARDDKIPLLTVSNHRSLVDDPIIMSNILPFWMNAQPKYLR